MARAAARSGRAARLEPVRVWDPGFELSFAAVLAIFVAVGPIVRVLEGYPLPQGSRAPLAVSVACSVATAPLLWLQFDNVPLLGVLANALAEPAVAPLLGLALVTAALDGVSPPLAEVLAWIDGLFAAYVAFCARAVAALPAAQASGRAAAVAAAVALGIAAYAWRRWRRSSERPT